MKVYAIIPVKSLPRTKRRLSRFLTQEQRKRLGLCMLEDVLTAVRNARGVERAVVVTPDREVEEFACSMGVLVLRECSDEGVNAAVARGTGFCLERGVEAAIIVPSDVPLLAPSDVEVMVRLCRGPPTVVLTPSRRLDGTNALLRSPPSVIDTSYERDSFMGHLRRAVERRVKLWLYFSRGVMLDLDTKEDLEAFMSEGMGTKTLSCLRTMLMAGSQA